MPRSTSPGGLRANLYREITRIIQSGQPLPDDAFNELALRLFSYQLSANAVYRGYFEAARHTRPDHWKQIPALPASAFKKAEIRSFPRENMKTWFQTSGTTENETGKHYFETLEIYEAALAPAFKRFMLPDKERMRMEILTPDAREMPHSSLVHMMETVKKNYGTPDSSFHMTNSGLDLTSLSASLNSAIQAQQPVLLLGTAFAFVYALEEMDRHHIKFNLPFGSRIMETGGFKGRVHEIPRPQFYQALSEGFSIPVFNIVNEYGMTELSSQFYDTSLQEQASSARKKGPAWTRVVAVNPDTGNEVPLGERGLIKIYDLANVGSIISVQTEDVGICYSDGSFEVLGRIGQSPVRGCSLTAENLLGPVTVA